jgi:hypothetical protein
MWLQEFPVEKLSEAGSVSEGKNSVVCQRPAAKVVAVIHIPR